MSDKKTIIGDKMVNSQLIANSNKLNISVDDLIERYVRRGLFVDDYFQLPRPVEVVDCEIFSQSAC